MKWFIRIVVIAIAIYGIYFAYDFFMAMRVAASADVDYEVLLKAKDEITPDWINYDGVPSEIKIESVSSKVPSPKEQEREFECSTIIEGYYIPERGGKEGEKVTFKIEKQIQVIKPKGKEIKIKFLD